MLYVIELGKKFWDLIACYEYMTGILFLPCIIYYSIVDANFFSCFAVLDNVWYGRFLYLIIMLYCVVVIWEPTQHDSHSYVQADRYAH